MNLYKIAIADDHKYMVKGLTLCLSGYNDCKVIIEAFDGIELIEKIRQSKDKPDVCLLDLSMPKMDGYEALARIKKEWPDIQILILSMHHNEFSIIKTLRDGAAGCLPKEADPDEIHKAIHEVMTRGFYHTELVAKYISSSLHDDLKKIKITDKEKIFMQHCCSDLSYKQIADKMKLSSRTIEGYRDTLFTKLNISSRSALVMFAVQSGIMPINYRI